MAFREQRNPHRQLVNVDKIQYMVSIIDPDDKWISYPEMPSKFVDGVEFIAVRRIDQPNKHHLIRKDSVKPYTPSIFR